MFASVDPFVPGGEVVVVEVNVVEVVELSEEVVKPVTLVGVVIPAAADVEVKDMIGVVISVMLTVLSVIVGVDEVTDKLAVCSAVASEVDPVDLVVPAGDVCVLNEAVKV